MSKSQEIISVIGPTASGKTALAHQIALKKLEKYAGIAMISADSRQIYRELPIISAADLEEHQLLEKKSGGRIKTYGLAIKNIGQEWSLGNFIDYCQPILRHARENNYLVMVVGGTMLYHQRFLENNDQTRVPPDDNLRFAAENMTVEQLQAWLQKIAPDDFATLNVSDQNNPRRLVRRLEIAMYHKLHPELNSSTPGARAMSANFSQLSNSSQLGNFSHQFITPKYNVDDLPAKIKRRVEERWQGGALQEVENLLTTHPDLPNNPKLLSQLPIGVAEISDFLQSKKSPAPPSTTTASFTITTPPLTEAATIDLWTLHEWQYAKRQLKWSLLKNCTVWET